METISPVKHDTTHDKHLTVRSQISQVRAQQHKPFRLPDLYQGKLCIHHLRINYHNFYKDQSMNPQPANVQPSDQVFLFSPPIGEGQFFPQIESPARVDFLGHGPIGRNQVSQVGRLKKSGHLHTTSQSTHGIIAFFLSLSSGILDGL